MKTILNLALKDLSLLRRDKAGLFWIFLFPLVFALFFGAISGGGGPMRGLTLDVTDEDGSPESQALITRLQKNEGLKVVAKSRADAESDVRRGDAHAFLVIPKGYGASGGFFGRNTLRPMVGMDPARKAESGYLEGMLMEAIYGGFAERFTDPKKALADARKSREDLIKLGDSEQKKLLAGFLTDMEKYLEKADFNSLGGDGQSMMMQPQLERIDVTQDATGKPRSAFELTFPSAVLWGLYGCVMAFAISIVTEKTQGTLLRLRTTPLTWGQILAGKGLGCFIACLTVSAVLILVAWFGFGVRVLQPGWLVVAIVLTAFAFTGLMMFVATLGSTERAVAGAASGIFMPLAMLGGGMIPLYVMPKWLQNAASVSPFKWGILSLEGASWRGYEAMDYLLPLGILIALGSAGFALGTMLLTRRSSL